MLPQVMGEFRLGADPELRFAPSGIAVCNARVVASSRKKNEAGDWVDDKECWLNATAFRRTAENMAESLSKGSLVVITGKIETSNWEDKDGNKRTSLNLLVDSIGPALALDPARTQKADRGGGGGGQWSSGGGSTPPPQDDAPPF